VKIRLGACFHEVSVGVKVPLSHPTNFLVLVQIGRWSTEPK
jgi:hypothetical protein